MLDLVVELASSGGEGCSYVDVRWVERTLERLTVSGGRVERVLSEQDEGIGVRVAARSGGFGFAATRDTSRAGGLAALRRATAIASSQPSAALRPLAPVVPGRGAWAGRCEIDPFAESIEARLELLLRADALLGGDPRIVRTQAESIAVRTRKAFASSEGAAFTQELTECGGGIEAHAADGDDVQIRSYPSAHGGSVAAAGYEHLLGLDLVGNARRVAEEAVALLLAPECPAGRTTLVLGDEQVALQVHESIGHALELDRIQLGEASYAGTSWVSPGDIGHLRYGSDDLRISADATLAGGLGSFGWDDEGVAGQRTMLIDSGILRAALSDRTSAASLGLTSSGGCARADGFSRQPIVRMTNVSIEPGRSGTLAELIGGVENGIYMETNRSWSIDDRRLHFQFATEVGREIRGGELGRLVKNASYAGLTPEFWGSLDGVCSASDWRVWGLLNCGKGEPGQVAHVSHGAAPARFRNVQVGVARR
ncbi:MAG TPA: TldD/PmbA family protein [Solirubrobacteraceae bacterium]|nr:TldD/PmbA family protein [Solirubrobacteraceae bacterium]